MSLRHASRPITVGPDRQANYRESFLALVHHAPEGGCWTQVPSLPGCATRGETLQEPRRNLREAITGWFNAQDHASVLAGARVKNAGKPTYSLAEARAKLRLSTTAKR